MLPTAKGGIAALRAEPSTRETRGRTDDIRRIDPFEGVRSVTSYDGIHWLMIPCSFSGGCWKGFNRRKGRERPERMQRAYGMIGFLTVSQHRPVQTNPSARGNEA